MFSVVHLEVFQLRKKRNQKNMKEKQQITLEEHIVSKRVEFSEQKL